MYELSHAANIAGQRAVVDASACVDSGSIAIADSPVADNNSRNDKVESL